MANLQIKGIEDGLYAEIKDLAAAENRSVSQQILFLVKEYLARKKTSMLSRPRPRFCWNFLAHGRTIKGQSRLLPKSKAPGKARKSWQKDSDVSTRYRYNYFQP